MINTFDALRSCAGTNTSEHFIAREHCDVSHSMNVFVLVAWFSGNVTKPVCVCVSVQLKVDGFLTSYVSNISLTFKLYDCGVWIN